MKEQINIEKSSADRWHYMNNYIDRADISKRKIKMSLRFKYKYISFT